MLSREAMRCPVTGSIDWMASTSLSKNITRKHWLPNSPKAAMMSTVSPLTRNVAGSSSRSVRV